MGDARNYTCSYYTIEYEMGFNGVNEIFISEPTHLIIDDYKRPFDIEVFMKLVHKAIENGG